MNLRPIQALALDESSTVGGLLGPIGVGEGKTLITLLLPMELNVRTAVLLVPAQLKKQLLEVDYPRYAQHFVLPNLADGAWDPAVKPVLYVISYNELSSPKKYDLLNKLKPDLIICDEAHALKHTSAARTKRFLRYFKANPGTKLCALSGTITAKSIRDFAHLSKLALGDGTPTPLAWPVLEEWANALDPIENRSPPGELVRLCKPGEEARDGFRRRLVETRGVVVSPPETLGVSLVIRERSVSLPTIVSDHLEVLRDTWCTPGGEEITDALSFSRFARQLASGFYYRWIWPRGEPKHIREEWVDARRDWHREIRWYLSSKASVGMDSPNLLALAASSGRWQADSWGRWDAIRGKARPETEAVWMDDYLVRDALSWALTNIGIIWYEHDAEAKKFAELEPALPIFGPGNGAIISESGTRTILASRRAHGTGKNLQMFNKQLVLNPVSNGAIWEQLLGRMHRTGQQADEVTCDVYLHTLEMLNSLNGARKDAEYIEQIKGSRQRLCYANYI